MAYKATETEAAEKDIDEILEYMANTLDNKKAACDFADNLDEKYGLLEDNPYLYEESRESYLKKRGYRRMPLNNYVALYLVDDEKEEVIIARVFYGRQDYLNLI